ncbi:MAG: hypothetical protein ACJ8C4_05810 [Gemmataceae bacterium]
MNGTENRLWFVAILLVVAFSCGFNTWGNYQLAGEVSYLAHRPVSELPCQCRTNPKPICPYTPGVFRNGRTFGEQQ